MLISTTSISCHTTKQHVPQQQLQHKPTHTHTQQPTPNNTPPHHAPVHQHTQPTNISPQHTVRECVQHTHQQHFRFLWGVTLYWTPTHQQKLPPHTNIFFFLRPLYTPRPILLPPSFPHLFFLSPDFPLDFPHPTHFTHPHTHTPHCRECGGGQLQQQLKQLQAHTPTSMVHNDHFMSIPRDAPPLPLSQPTSHTTRGLITIPTTYPHSLRAPVLHSLGTCSMSTCTTSLPKTPIYMYT